MIDSFRAKNYGCLKDVQLALTGFQALIGPNDSGKSTILRALRTILFRVSGGTFSGTTTLWTTPFDPGFGPPPWHGAKLTATSSGGVYQLVAKHAIQETVSVGPGTVASLVASSGLGAPLDSERSDNPPKIAKAMESFGTATLVRLDADALRRPSALIPDATAKQFTDERGAGLPGIYQAIQGLGDDSFSTISERFKALFPTVKRLGVRAVSEHQLEMEVGLLDGSRVGARQMSEGMLYYLAFAALPYIQKVDLLLVEEPENGLHPSRIADVAKMLRAFHEESGTKVLMATHSPLVVNELEPEEVIVVTRHPERGTRLTPMPATKDFASRSKVYALGELWLSYANGADEKDLVGDDGA